MATERPIFLCRKCGSTNPQVWTDVVNDDDGAADTLSARQTRCQAAGTNYAEEPSQNRPAVNHVGPASSAMTGSCGSPSTRGRGCDSRFHYERFAELPRTNSVAAEARSIMSGSQSYPGPAPQQPQNSADNCGQVSLSRGSITGQISARPPNLSWWCSDPPRAWRAGPESLQRGECDLSTLAFEMELEDGMRILPEGCTRPVSAHRLPHSRHSSQRLRNMNDSFSVASRELRRAPGELRGELRRASGELRPEASQSRNESFSP